MKIFMILLFALISVISAALIPRGVSNALRSDLRSFPLKNDKMLVSSPRRVMSNKAVSDNVPAKPNYSMSGIIAGMSLSTALMATYLLNHEDLFSDNANSAALIPRGVFNALRSNLRSFPFENDMTIAFNPKRMASTMAVSDNFPAKPDNFMSGIIAGMLLSTALMTTYLLNHEDLLSNNAKKNIHEYEVKVAKLLVDDVKTVRARCFEAITSSNTLDFEKYCLSKSIDINYPDENRVTAMELAIKLGRSQFIVPLLRAGVNIRIRDRQGHGYLAMAIETRNKEVLKELLTVEHALHDIGQAGRYHFQRSIEEGDVDMIKAWIRGGINYYDNDINGRCFLETAILSIQRGSFDAILDSKFYRLWDYQRRKIIRTIMRERNKASPEIARKMNYPEMIARIYVKCDCDHGLYEYIESLGVSKEELESLKQIETISCRK